MEILKAFADIGMPTLLDFLVVEFNSTQFEISLHAAKAIKAIDSNFLLQINAANIDDEYQHQEIKMQLTHNI